MRDVSKWAFAGFGEDSTLPKEVLLSPDNSRYYMKYAWESKTPRTHLEDVNEVIAAKIAELLQLNTIKAELAYRNGKRGCLSLDYVEQYRAELDEAGAVLLELEFGESYRKLQNSRLKGVELIDSGFDLLNRFSYFNKIRYEFISMNLFDILIGNQDRHPYNWVMLFSNSRSFFGPLYDNGASLVFQLPDERLVQMISDKNQMENYYLNMRVKLGLFECKKAPVLATDVLTYCITNYKDEVKQFEELLLHFSLQQFDDFLNQFPLFTDTRKHFLKVFIRHRREKILEAIKEGS